MCVVIVVSTDSLKAVCPYERTVVSLTLWDTASQGLVQAQRVTAEAWRKYQTSIRLLETTTAGSRFWNGIFALQINPDGSGCDLFDHTDNLWSMQSGAEKEGLDSVSSSSLDLSIQSWDLLSVILRQPIHIV